MLQGHQLQDATQSGDDSVRRHKVGAGGISDHFNATGHLALPTTSTGNQELQCYAIVLGMDVLRKKPTLSQTVSWILLRDIWVSRGSVLVPP